MCVFKRKERATPSVTQLISGNKNISLIELFNCPLNPAERPCCCLVGGVCVCVLHVLCVCPVCWDVNGSACKWREAASEHEGSFCV